MVEAVFPADTASPSAARRFVAASAGPTLAEECLEVAVLLTSELVTNAVVHAHSEVRVVLDTPDGGVRVSVSDTCDADPVMGRFSTSGESGRGLALVVALADAWGVTPDPAGKTVWFSLAGTR